MRQVLIDKFKNKSAKNTANTIKGKYRYNKNQANIKGDKCKEGHSAWVPQRSYDYCDKNPNTKDPKCRDELIAKRKARKDKRGDDSSTTHCKDNEMSELKATVAAQKKLLAFNEAQTKALEMESAAKITFNEDEDLEIQSAVLQSYLTTL